ncbi:putative REP-associated tyrosine transposase [Marinicella pacifica]|uniref:REP-associated tyrosine transposase n=1 Tax=Marinicella pacifica TaxID=1171543 RepID=A0A917CRR8_9GAMM|nr:transposase [Marinicella pacifica]GGF94313.1 putative REP-associated tyrosine transposase [Marinicella pacifica]
MPNFRRVFVENSCVFITVAINNRKRALLSEYMAEFKLALKTVKNQVHFKVHAIAVMPEHFHMIIRPRYIVDYPKMVSLIKIKFSKSLPQDLKTELSKEVSISKINKRESGVWQRRFYEHTIRDELELNHLTDYIHFNPVKHGLVDKPCEWSHSSFMRFVENGFYDLNWCDFTELKDYH